jgi:hypothetical protein
MAGKFVLKSRTLQTNTVISIVAAILEVISAVNPESLPENWRGIVLGFTIIANSILRLITKEPLIFKLRS